MLLRQCSGVFCIYNIDSILIISPLATRKGCLGVDVGFLPFGCNFISSIFLQFSDESHISPLDLTDQKLRAKKIRHDLIPHRNTGQISSNQLVLSSSCIVVVVGLVKYF